MKRSLVLLTFAGAAIGAAPALAADLNVTVEVPRLTVAEYHKPYVAIWVEAPDASAAGDPGRLVRRRLQARTKASSG